MNQLDPQSEGAKKRSEKEQKLREKIEKRRTGFDKSKAGLKAKFQEAYDKRRAGGVNTEEYEKLKAKREAKRQSIQQSYDATRVKSEAYLEKKMANNALDKAEDFEKRFESQRQDHEKKRQEILKARLKQRELKQATARMVERAKQINPKPRVSTSQTHENIKKHDSLKK